MHQCACSILVKSTLFARSSWLHGALCCALCLHGTQVWDAVAQRVPERARWIDEMGTQLEEEEERRRAAVEGQLVQLVRACACVRAGCGDGEARGGGGAAGAAGARAGGQVHRAVRGALHCYCVSVTHAACWWW